MKFHLITLLLLVGAVACYFVGFGEGIVPFVAAYVIVESVLSIRLINRRRQKREQRQRVLS